MFLISIDLIKDKQYDIKEACPFKTAKVLRSLEKYKMQLKPILVFLDDDEKYQLVAGSTLLKQMKMLGYKEVMVVDIGKKTIIEQVDICNLLDQSVRDVDLLKFANLIKMRLSDYTDEQIAHELGIHMMEVKVLKDLLDLKFTYEQQKDNSQIPLFSDENS